MDLVPSSCIPEVQLTDSLMEFICEKLDNPEFDFAALLNPEPTTHQNTEPKEAPVLTLNSSSLTTPSTHSLHQDLYHTNAQNSYHADAKYASNPFPNYHQTCTNHFNISSSTNAVNFLNQNPGLPVEFCPGTMQGMVVPTVQSASAQSKIPEGGTMQGMLVPAPIPSLNSSSLTAPSIHSLHQDSYHTNAQNSYHATAKYAPSHFPNYQQTCTNHFNISSSTNPVNFLNQNSSFPVGLCPGTMQGMVVPAAQSASARSIAVRDRRKRISGKTQELAMLIPSGTPLSTAEMLLAASKYVKFLQAQIGILAMIDPTKARNEKNSSRTEFVNGF